MSIVFSAHCSVCTRNKSSNISLARDNSFSLSLSLLYDRLFWFGFLFANNNNFCITSNDDKKKIEQLSRLNIFFSIEFNSIRLMSWNANKTVVFNLRGTFNLEIFRLLVRRFVFFLLLIAFALLQNSKYNTSHNSNGNRNNNKILIIFDQEKYNEHDKKVLLIALIYSNQRIHNLSQYRGM